MVDFFLGFVPKVRPERPGTARNMHCHKHLIGLDSGRGYPGDSGAHLSS